MAEEYTGFLYAAHKDAITVEALLSDPDLYCEPIAFHAQQAAEKMIKNIYEENDRQAEFTHDIGRLFQVALDEEWVSATEDQVRSIVSLSKFAVAARYETAPDITGSEALAAVASCNLLADVLKEAGWATVRIDSDAHLAIENEASAEEDVLVSDEEQVEDQESTSC